MDVRDAVTDQQNEPKCVSTIIGHLIGGVRLGFEGLHGLMGCSQGYINRVWRCSLEYIVIHCGGKKLGKNSSKEFVPLPETYAKLGIFCLSVCVSVCE